MIQFKILFVLLIPHSLSFTEYAQNQSIDLWEDASGVPLITCYSDSMTNWAVLNDHPISLVDIDSKTIDYYDISGDTKNHVYKCFNSYNIHRFI